MVLSCICALQGKGSLPLEQIGRLILALHQLYLAVRWKAESLGSGPGKFAPFATMGPGS